MGIRCERKNYCFRVNLALLLFQMISSDNKPDSFRLTRVVESEMNSKQSQTTLAEPKTKGRSKTVSSSGNTRVGMVTLLSPVNRADQLCCYCATAITIKFLLFQRSRSTHVRSRLPRTCFQLAPYNSFWPCFRRLHVRNSEPNLILSDGLRAGNLRLFGLLLTRENFEMNSSQNLIPGQW